MDTVVWFERNRISFVKKLFANQMLIVYGIVRHNTNKYSNTKYFLHVILCHRIHLMIQYKTVIYNETI